VPKLSLGSLASSADSAAVEPTPREVSGGLDTSLASAEDAELRWLMGAASDSVISPTSVPKLVRLSSIGTPGSKAVDPTPRELSSGLDTSIASADASELGWLTSTNINRNSSTALDSLANAELSPVAEVGECSSPLQAARANDPLIEHMLGPTSQQPDQITGPSNARLPWDVNWKENAIGGAARGGSELDVTTPVAVWHHGQWTVFSLNAGAFKQLSEGDSDSSPSTARSNFSAIEAFDQGLDNASAEETDWLGNVQIDSENLLATPRRSLQSNQRSNSQTYSPLRPTGIPAVSAVVTGDQDRNAGTGATPQAGVSDSLRSLGDSDTRGSQDAAKGLPGASPSAVVDGKEAEGMDILAELKEQPAIEEMAEGGSASSQKTTEVQLMIELTECHDDEGEWLTSGENTPLSVVDSVASRPPRVSVGGDESEERWLPSCESTPRSPLIASTTASENPGQDEGRPRSSRMQVSAPKVSIPKPAGVSPRGACLSAEAGSNHSPVSNQCGVSPSASSELSSALSTSGFSSQAPTADTSHHMALSSSPSCSQASLSPSERISPKPRGTAFVRTDQQRQPPSKIPEPCGSCNPHHAGHQRLPGKSLEQYYSRPSRIPAPECSL